VTAVDVTEVDVAEVDVAEEGDMTGDMTGDAAADVTRSFAAPALGAAPELRARRPSVNMNPPIHADHAETADRPSPDVSPAWGFV
jgi:hypothetical protein